MDIKKRIEAKPGQVWKTKHGHLVRVLASQSREIIETAYVEGRVDGRLGINFDGAGAALRGNDRLVERVK